MNKWLIIGITTVLLLIWSVLIEPNMLEISRYKIADSRLRGLKIVFASDFHISPIESFRLKRTINAIMEEKPDIIILGGDYVKGHRWQYTMPIHEIAEHLGKLKAKYGVYAVLGNHDWYLDAEATTVALRENRITVLNNESNLIKFNGKNLYLIGIDDISMGKPNINEAFYGTMEPRIFITHNPEIFASLKQKVSLVLAGHTHGGQIKIPFWGPLFIPSKLSRKYAEGLIEENNNKMIVSRGLGTSILPIRFNCKPEITVVEFE